VAAYLYFEFRFKVTTLGSFVLPLVTLLLIGSSAFPSELRPLNPALQSAWIYSHTLLAFGAYAFFTIAGGVAGMYLLQSHFLKRNSSGRCFKSSLRWTPWTISATAVSPTAFRC